MTKLKNIAYYVSDKIDVCTIKVQDYISTDNMLVNRGGITDCDSLPQTTRATKYLPGDVLVSNIRPYFKKIWYADRTSGCSNDVIVFRANNDKMNSKFLYYVLSQDSFFDFMMAGSNGTKMPRGNKKTIPDFIVPEFDINKQRIIADILSAYDDLIENNQKQIKHLEEAAQRLYKEWFVDLRFPGYEDTTIVDGMPEGWKIVSLNSVTVLKAGGDKPKLCSDNKTDECQIPIFSNGISNKGLYGYTNKPVVKKESVTISARGTVGFVFLHRTPFVPIVRLISVTPKDDLIDVLYLYLNLSNQDFRATGAAQQQITVPLLKDKTILCPSLEIREIFNNKILSVFNQIDVLEKQMLLAQQARDRLLPKLMSGELEV